MRYSRTGEGMHRFTDPADGETYLYDAVFMDDAQRVFAVLRPARPQGAVRALRHRPAELDRARQRLAGRDRPTAAGSSRPPRRSPPTSSPSSPAPGTRCTPSTRAAVRPPLPALPRPAPRRRRRGDPRRHPRLLRPLPRAVRRAVPVRLLRPGVRARIQLGRHGEPRLRHLPRRVRLPLGASPTPSAQTRAMVIAHEMAHMWFGDLVTMSWWDDTLAQRVVRRVHGLPGRHRGHRASPAPGRLRRRAASLGLRRRPAPLHPPRRPGAEPSPTPPPPCSTSTGSPTPRAPPRCASWSPGSARRTSWPASTPTSPGTGSPTPPWPTSSTPSPPQSLQ